MTGKADGVGSGLPTGNLVEGKEGFVEETGEGTADEGDFLVEGIEGGVGKVLDVALPAAGIDGGGKEGVDAEKFVAMIGEGLESDTFRMTEVEKVEGLGKRGEGDLQVAVVGQEDAIIGCD